MKVTLNWLKQYVDFTWSPEELRERLTMLGIEVEGMQPISGEFEGVVVAQILSSEKHPNADKLSVCRVADGRGERQICSSCLLRGTGLSSEIRDPISMGWCGCGSRIPSCVRGIRHG